MGYLSGQQRRQAQRMHTIERVMVVVVVASIVALIVWIVSNAGGGHLMF